MSFGFGAATGGFGAASTPATGGGFGAFGASTAATGAGGFGSFGAGASTGVFGAKPTGGGFGGEFGATMESTKTHNFTPLTAFQPLADGRWYACTEYGSQQSVT